MTRRDLGGWLVRLVGSAIGVAALCGALPGEVNGCDTDLSDEVNHIEYCRERCSVICELVVTCGRYRVPDDAPDDATPLDLCRQECETRYSCDAPQLCDPALWAPEQPYVSTEEANTCLDDMRKISCQLLREGAPNCGRDFGQCPVPDTCTGEVLCDPPEWER